MRPPPPYFCPVYNRVHLLLLYNIFIWVYQWLLKLAALRNRKARAWVEGRRGLLSRLEESLGQNAYPIIWIHSASTGEFEQAKPVIEAMREQFPQYKILATFFSPSGYESATNYAAIDYCFYLPTDTAANARRFVQIIKPALVVFSKYDFWHHYLKTINKGGTPLLLISAVFRQEQSFFRWYGGFNRAMLRRFTHIFVQDEASLALLQSIGISKCSLGGDTRFDRVQDIVHRVAATADAIQLISEQLVRKRPCVVAGSTWQGDEALIASVTKNFPDMCWLIVPHEINKAHLSELRGRFPGAVLFSGLTDAFDAKLHKTNEPLSRFAAASYQPPVSNIYIIDVMGLLSRLYSVATIAYVGGGFTKDGIHNTLEAAVWGKPVIMGPNYKKYREAKGLIAAGGAFSVANAAQLQQQIGLLTHDKAALEAASDAAQKFVQNGAGATRHFMQFIQEKRLLTN